ncbi:hypothetical protein Tco_1344805 [Tanacetum coccineum]
MYDNSFARPPKTLKDDSETVIDSNNDYSSSDGDSYEDIDYVDASPPDSELVSLEEVKDFHLKDGELEDDVLHEKLSKINLLIAKIEALKDNPTPSSDLVTKSSSTSPNLFWKRLTPLIILYPNLKLSALIWKRIVVAVPLHSDISLSKYDSFIFDLSINPFADRSDLYHEEFAGELAHIISPPEYDHFCFKIEPELGNLTMDVVGDIFPTREPRVRVLPTLNLDFILSSESLFAYVVWIFLPFLTYPVTPPHLLFCGNEDTILTPASPFIILLCWVYLIGVELL